MMLSQAMSGPGPGQSCNTASTPTLVKKKSQSVSSQSSAPLHACNSLVRQASELGSPGPERRNWRGIGIAVLVICLVCALIVLSVVLLSPGSALEVTGSRLTLSDLARFQPRSNNATWVSESEILYLDHEDRLVLWNVANGSRAYLLDGSVVRRHAVKEFWLSPDRKYALLLCEGDEEDPEAGPDQPKVYAIADLHSKHVRPLMRDLPVIQYAQWGTQRNQLVYVQDWALYYLPEVMSSQSPMPLAPRSLDHLKKAMPDKEYARQILRRPLAVWWSPNGNSLCYATFDYGMVNRSSYVWYGERKVQNDDRETIVTSPQIVTRHYAKPGSGIPSVSLWVANLQQEETFPQDQVLPPVELRFREFYVTGVSWMDDSRLVITWMKRLQNHSYVTICDNRLNWACEKLVEESNLGSGWVDPFEIPLITEDKSAFFLRLPIAAGAAGNFRHVAMLPINKEIRQRTYLTYGHYDVTTILAYQSKTKTMYYLATSKGRPGQQHIYSVSEVTARDSDDRRTTCLTCNDGCLFNEAIFSPGAEFYVLICQGPGVPRTEVRRADDQNSLVAVLDQNEHLIDLLSSRALPQTRTLTLPLYAGHEAIVKLHLPPGLSEGDGSKLPLLVHMCSEPAVQCVSERFELNWATQLVSRRQAVVMEMDARGSAGRGDRLEHLIYRQIGVPEADDLLQVIRYLKQELPYVDDDKVAIWGQGYGGYVAITALLDDNNGALSCAVALSPITNWKEHSALYTEKFMQSPDASDNFLGYEMTNLLRRAEDFRGKKLMVVHGTADEQVHVHHTMMLNKALVKSGITWFQQLYPDEGHALSGVRDHLHVNLEKFLEQQCFRSTDGEPPGGRHPRKQKPIKGG